MSSEIVGSNEEYYQSANTEIAQCTLTMRELIQNQCAELHGGSKSDTPQYP